ncbi:MAG: lysylphosphatidylglycerol synthase transmembrane domain-containing protein [Candidatus Manganitrophus sp.]|nr:lysylphosphatidylglycerol synthase transmembrane domain-containing protein [Candidatus Manganitrophus sp.]MDC4226041.1 lysylphosphatidylglycerol synthase transmembrane domain-containing protein [Candidatus Manganitrophus sp.]WDT72703.1 MAG: lysylphosphatidylglycerol synthase transmembrane domain-containing protein [Candidatus Manganitrophus sp.]
MKKSSSITALKSIISLVILYALFLKIDISSLWEKMRSVHPGIVLLGACIFIGVQCVSTYRWSIILEKDVDIPYRNLLSIYFIGMFFNNFLPTMIGGDAVKGYYLYKVTGKGGFLGLHLYGQIFRLYGADIYRIGRACCRLSTD